MRLKNLSPSPQSRSARFAVVHAIWYCCCLIALMNVGPWWCKAKPILIYQGVHCCTNVCYLHLDIIPSSQVVSLPLKSVIHGGCKLLCSNGHLDRSRCSPLISALLKSVSTEYLEQDVTCLNERVFIKNYVPSIDQLQPIYFACNGLYTKAYWFTSLAKCVQGIVMQSNESFVKSVVLKSMFLKDHPRWATVQRTFVGSGCAYTL